MSSSRKAGLVLLLAAAAGGAFRVAGISTRHTFTHDEGISYLAATGHQGEYARVTAERSRPCGVPVKASEWKRFVLPEGRFCFARIGSDLARFDIHPPLYFWLLHLWLLAVGTGVRTGLVLNLAIDLAALWALYRLAKYVLGDSLDAALVCLLWAVSPAVMETSLQARPYGLLALWAILFGREVVRVGDTSTARTWRNDVWTAAVVALGALTHYHAWLFLAGGGLFLVFRLYRRHKGRLLAAAASLAAGVVISFVLNPGFAAAFQRQRVQAQPFEPDRLGVRVLRAAQGLAGFFLDRGTTDRVVPRRFSLTVMAAGLSICAVILVGAAMLLWRGRRRLLGWMRERDVREAFVIYSLLWIAGTTLFLYLAFLSPKHAVQGRHLAMVWPFLSFVPVLVLRSTPRIRARLTFLVLLVMFASASSGLVVRRAAAGAQLEASRLVAAADTVLCDSTGRGVLPGIVWHVRDDAAVLAADQRYLLANPAGWAEHLRKGGLYVGSLIYGNTPAGQRQILDVMRRRHEVVLLRKDVLYFGDLFQVKARDVSSGEGTPTDQR